MSLLLGLRFARTWTRAGLYTLLYFHLMVCLTPAPNDISLFAVQCASRLVLLMDPVALEQVLNQCRGRSIGLGIVAIASIWYGVRQEWTPLNFGFLVYASIFGVLHWTLIVEAASSSSLVLKEENGTKGTPTTTTIELSSNAKNTSNNATSKRKRPGWTYAATFGAIFYSYGTIMLGTMEEASCNMFANLKIHGGSNHLLLPTGLLFRWFRHAGDSHPFGGGEIRLESTDSAWLQMIYPNDLTHLLQPAPQTANLLAKVLQIPPPYFHNGGANRVLGLRERGWIPAPPNKSFLQYTVPSLEWKRLLQEALVKDGTFRATYAHLPGYGGNEEWRAHAWERRVHLQAKDGVIVKCKVHYFVNSTKAMCQESDLPYQLLDTVPWWVRKIGLYHGYPILFESDGKTVRNAIQCFGP